MCRHDDLEFAGDTAWCRDCGELIADTRGGFNIDATTDEGGRTGAGRLTDRDLHVLILCRQVRIRDVPALKGMARNKDRRCEYPGCTTGPDGGPGIHHGLGFCTLHYSRAKLGMDMDKPFTESHRRLSVVGRG